MGKLSLTYASYSISRWTEIVECIRSYDRLAEVELFNGVVHVKTKYPEGLLDYMVKRGVVDPTKDDCVVDPS